jgi:hypothetical protein
MQLGFGLGGDEAGADGEALSSNAYLRLWIGAQISQPVGRRVFGDQVKASVAAGEPDLDFAGQTTLAAARREI